jgi:signal transduction histidine kinase
MPVEPRARYCEYCGVDLALAAVFAERQMVTPLQVPQGLPIAPEILVPRMGDTMLEKGILSPEQLHRALEFQKERQQHGEHLLLGQALLALELVDRETLDQIITLQILQLQNALSTANRQLEQRVEERTQDLKHALDRLSELNQLKSNFVANISHELRTPLTHLKGYLDILADGSLGDLTPEQSDALAVLQRAEDRLEQLIENLIQFSMASRGELNLQKSTIDLVDLAETALNQARTRAKNNSIALHFKHPPTSICVRVDVEKLGWALTQLLDNALKFTPAAGVVEIELLVEDSMVTVAVNDNGIGIPKERLQEIFEPFHQLDGSATRRYGGTGMGLSMVRQIVEAHGSQIKVESYVGKGSRFEFSLPILEKS